MSSIINLLVLVLALVLVGEHGVDCDPVRTPRGCVCSDFTWFNNDGFVSMIIWFKLRYLQYMYT